MMDSTCSHTKEEMTKPSTLTTTLLPLLFFLLDVSLLSRPIFCLVTSLLCSQTAYLSIFVAGFVTTESTLSTIGSPSLFMTDDWGRRRKRQRKKKVIAGPSTIPLLSMTPSTLMFSTCNSQETGDECSPTEKPTIYESSLLSKSCKSFTIKELKELLRQYGAKVSGSKRELADRLGGIISDVDDHKKNLQHHHNLNRILLNNSAAAEKNSKVDSSTALIMPQATFDLEEWRVL